MVHGNPVAGISVRERVRRALLGVSGYQPPQEGMVELGDASVARTREAFGGNIQTLPTTKVRWYLAELEEAQRLADTGNLRDAARLYRAMYRDGVLRGLLGTRTSGLVRLPKRFYGDSDLCKELAAKNGTRSVFDDMCPPSELGLLAADGIVLGVGVAELVPVPGRDYPILIRLDPEFLRYFWPKNCWMYASVAGLLPITPGDGRWVLHCPGGRIAPWNSASWPALGRSFINKEHALFHRSNYVNKLANPARVAVSPQGATEPQRDSFFQRVLAWAQDTVFGLPPGWDVKLIESSGRGIDVFQNVIDTSDKEYSITLSGQTVTTTGGAGFQNADSFKGIRLDLVQDTGDGLAYTVNTQVLPKYTSDRKGIGAIPTGPCVEWNVDQPKDLIQAASALTGAAAAYKSLSEAVAEVRDANGNVVREAPRDKDGRPIEIDATELFVRFGVPVKGDADGDGVPDHILAAREAATQPESPVESSPDLQEAA